MSKVKGLPYEMLFSFDVSIEEARLDVAEPHRPDDLDAVLRKEIVVQALDAPEPEFFCIRLHHAAIRINGRRRQRFVLSAIQVQNGDLLQLRRRKARFEY